MKTDIKLGGYKEFDNLLRNLPGNIAGRALQSAVTGAIREAAKDIRKAAPRNDGDQSPASEKYGPIRKNIKVKRLRRTDRGQRGARVDTGKAFWAVFYEKGTRYQPARPWFKQAFENATPKVLANFRDRLQTAIEKEVIKLRGKI